MNALELAGALVGSFLLGGVSTLWAVYVYARRLTQRKLNPLIEAMAAYTPPDE